MSIIRPGEYPRRNYSCLLPPDDIDGVIEGRHARAFLKSATHFSSSATLICSQARAGQGLGVSQMNTAVSSTLCAFRCGSCQLLVGCQSIKQGCVTVGYALRRRR